MGRTISWFKGLLGLKKEKDPNASERKEKKRWSFAQSGRDSSSDVGQIQGSIPSDIPAVEAAWLRSYYTETDKEQNKQAIAVAAATAAAADAAVAAAQAAVAVVRLTSHGRGTMFGGARERWGAVKIQTVFRGYLARKALRALKGLVKLQALVRGYLVRRQAAATLHSMQALIRAQATVRLHKTHGLIKREHRDIRPRRSIERFDDSRSEHPASIHSRRLSVSADNLDESPKIVEIDTCRPKSRSRRTNPSVSDFGEDPYQMPSPLPSQMPTRLSIPEGRNFHDHEWGYTGDECRFSTAQSTPRFMNSNPSNAPVTPAKSVCADRYSYFPNYMANTQSFRAKVRSQSAPKQRPDSLPKKRLSLSEMVESRASLSGVRMQKSCSQAQEVINFKNTVMCKFDRASDSAQYVRDTGNDYLERRW